VKTEIEKQYQRTLIDLLNKLGVKYIHIPNQIFKARGLYKSVKHLKSFPDILFCYNKKTYMIEFGIKEGKTVRHKKRKEEQAEYMKAWECQGVDCRFIFSQEETDNFIKEVFFDYFVKKA
jgi:hypothetical protein